MGLNRKLWPSKPLFKQLHCSSCSEPYIEAVKIFLYSNCLLLLESLLLNFIKHSEKKTTFRTKYQIVSLEMKRTKNSSSRGKGGVLRALQLFIALHFFLWHQTLSFQSNTQNRIRCPLRCRCTGEIRNRTTFLVAGRVS